MTAPALNTVHDAEQQRKQANRDKREAAEQRKKDRERAELQAKVDRFMGDQPGMLAWLIEREALLAKHITTSAGKAPMELVYLHDAIRELRSLLALKMAHFAEKLERYEARLGEKS